jgi:disulfide bond formation protein DsbB
MDKTTMRRNALYHILAVAVLALTVVPIGTAVFVLGFVFGDSPCVMCWEQRTGMALVALVGLFILRYGPRPQYIGMGVLIGAWGVHMGLRHVGMHAARDVGQGFSLEILGAHTYTWSLFIFWICIVTMGALLALTREDDVVSAPRTLRPLEKLAMLVFLAVIAGNAVQAFASTGPPPFIGQSDPVRFSFNPRHWVWSLEEYSGTAPISWRGRWAVDKPNFASLPGNPDAGPLANLPVLTMKPRAQLGPWLHGTPTSLAGFVVDETTDRFAVTTEHGVYIVDGAFERVLRRTEVDPGYSVDLGRFAGAAFLDVNTVMAMGENKSYVILKENDRADADKNFRFFLDYRDQFDEVSRSRLGTVRARMMYSHALAYDGATNSVYTASVPNAKTKRLVISRFDRRDLILSEEFTPTLAPESGLTWRGDKRSLDEYVVTGALVEGGQMLAVSAAFNTLLKIDLASHRLSAAYALPGLVRPIGIAQAKNGLVILCENGAVVTVAGPW